jgi:[ribosomal protein S5]-alanine N-acetyltransferase
MNELILESKRLTLRTIRKSDLSNIYEMLIKPESTEFNPTIYSENVIETKKTLNNWSLQFEQGKNRKNFTFLIETTIDCLFVGVISIDIIKLNYKNAEIWYKLDPEVWSNGYATEALCEIIKFGFEDLKLHRIEGGCAINNIASYKVMEKAGMIREAHRRKLLPLKSGWSDNYEYAILEEDFFKI